MLLFMIQTQHHILNAETYNKFCCSAGEHFKNKNICSELLLNVI